MVNFEPEVLELYNKDLENNSSCLDVNKWRVIARDFANHFLSPNVRRWDDQQIFPAEILREAGRYGLMGILVSKDLGGQDLDYLCYSAIIEELSIVDPSFALSVAAHNSLCTNHVYLYGKEKHKQWIRNLATGRSIGSWGLTESTAGSDVKGMGTIAQKIGNDQWIINGKKRFITHGASSDLLVLLARTDVDGVDCGITSFLVERGAKGFIAGKKDDKLGMRSSETAELIFEDCLIRDDNRLGEIGQGYSESMKILEGGRVSIAALSLGIAVGAYNEALKHAKNREQFGKPIIDFQAIGFKLAEMATEIAASRLLVEKAAQVVRSGIGVTIPVCMAKLHASETCVKVASEALQIMGGYGYMRDSIVEKYYRDSKLCTIGEGTSEIQKLILSRKLAK